MTEAKGLITRSDIETAQTRIQSYLRRTPVLEIEGGALGIAAPIALKLEQFQHTGSFKPRGAFNALLSKNIPSAGVVAASGGNHGAAVAYAASVLGVPARIFVPEYAGQIKIERIRGFGAEVVVIGSEFSATLAASRDYEAESGAVSVHPFDQFETVAGQGTLGREIEHQLPDIDVLLVSVGGGGLIGGIAAWYGDRIKIVAVESEGTPTLATALADGPNAEIKPSGIAASALGAPTIGAISYGIVHKTLDRSVLVSDTDIVDAQRRLWSAARIVSEPGGVTALAALTSGAYRPATGDRVAVLICGANADPDWFVS